MDPREEIRSRVSLRELVGRYVELKPAGRGRYKGLCPFHQEKTPSFYVDEEKGLFYCFGCKAGGDAFSFLERIEGLSFAEALERLAAETGVELPRRPQEKRPPDLYQINALALRFFRSQMGEKARAYLEARGIPAHYAEAFQLGYAPPGWDRLTQHLAREGVELGRAVAAGVLAEKDGRVYDRFRDRLIVPILDPSGRVVAFSGRTLDPEGRPKYLNSPESPIFKKRELLFGLPQAREAIRERKRAIVVEGLFDVIALHLLGWKETVAVLGSAFTPEQALLLKRLGVVDLYLAFDADEAGRKATLAGLDLAIVRAFRVYAARLPEGTDPGDLVHLEDGREVFARALETALPEVLFRFEEAARGQDTDRPEGKRAVLEALLPRLVEAEPFDPVAESLKALILDRLGLRPEALEELIQRRRKKRRRSLTTAEVAGAGRAPDRVLLLELDIVALLLALPVEQLRRWAGHVEDHTWPPEGAFLAEFFRIAREEGYDPRRIQRRLTEREEGAVLFERLMLASPPPPAELERTLAMAMARLREGYYRRRLEKLKAGLEKGADPELLKEIQALQEAIEAERRLYRSQL